MIRSTLRPQGSEHITVVPGKVVSSLNVEDLPKQLHVDNLQDVVALLKEWDLKRDGKFLHILSK